MESLSAEGDSGGMWAGSAVVRNDQTDVRGSSFSFTILRDGQDVAALVGTADAVAAGKTVTVKLHSADAYAPGDYQYRLSTGLGF